MTSTELFANSQLFGSYGETFLLFLAWVHVSTVQSIAMVSLANLSSSLAQVRIGDCRVWQTCTNYHMHAALPLACALLGTGLHTKLLYKNSPPHADTVDMTCHSYISVCACILQLPVFFIWVPLPNWAPTL